MPAGSSSDTDDSLSRLTSLSSSSASDKQHFYVEVPEFPVDKGLYILRSEAYPSPEPETPPMPEVLIDEVIGEYKLGSELYLFARYKGGIVRKYPEKALWKQYSSVVQEYERRKEAGTLAPFDPSASYVHPNSRIKLVFSVAKGRTKAQTRIGPPGKRAYIDNPASDSPSDAQEESESSKGDSVDTDESYNLKIRIKARPKAVKKLPFSPRKTRSRAVHVVNDTDEESYEQASDASLRPRRSTRTSRAKQALQISDDEESEEFSSEFELKPRKKAASKAKRRPKLSRPAYGEIRHIREADDANDDPLTAHRQTCEKCGLQAAHELPRKKKSRRKRDEFEVSSDDDNEKLGGWVRCLKCPVSAHWSCLNKAQQAEILKAIREKAFSDPEASFSTPKPKEITKMQMTEFICHSCIKGGICVGCKDVALEPDTTLVSKPKAPGATGEGTPSADSAPEAKEANTADAQKPTTEIEEPISTQLLFRCLTCKRLAHYEHLPPPDDTEGWDATALAEHYQETNKWLCSDCLSFSSRELDLILAWRPVPLTEWQSRQPIDPKPTYRSQLPREYLVKWQRCSFRHLRWVPHMWLLSTQPAKLRHFFENGSRVQLLTGPSRDSSSMDVDEDSTVPSNPNTPRSDGSSLDAQPDAEQLIPSSWCTVDRVLDILVWSPPKLRVSKHKQARSRRRTQVSDSDNERDELDSAAQAEQDAAYDLGEQPQEQFTETIQEWEKRTGKSLTIDDADKVIWAFIKWDDLTYDQATWDCPPRPSDSKYDAFKRAFALFLESRNVTIPVRSAAVYREYSDRPLGKFRTTYALKEGENIELGQDEKLKLMPFQVDGFNWLCDNWWNKQNCILADEMGLGKTVQIATFLGNVITKFKAMPALIVVPNSTITNWIRELERWAPGIRAVPFYGEEKCRQVIKQYELRHGDHHDKKTTGAKFHVLVTTYETLINQKEMNAVFKKEPHWEILVIDEGQRLKNDNSLIFKKLNELDAQHRIIMTGTPLNNNIRELFNLMNFLDPDQWDDLEALEREHEVLDEDSIKQLHHRLRPYFLRRIKSEVLKLPPKNEVIVPVSMTPIQKEVYRSILSNNLGLLKGLVHQTLRNTTRMSSNNMLMQLRKCLQHPYIYNPDLEPKDSPDVHQKLTDASAKLRFLKPLLLKLKTRGHRVLIFSQFVIALNVIEDFLVGEGHKYLRLDGNVSQHQRQRDMDTFNEPGSDVFVFLLTTRAGGVGINLWSADTVIIFDPDFNPHQDLQAIARAHRYGQQKTCLVFKLIVKDSAEERIMQVGKKKLVLDHLIVQTMDNDDESGDVKSMITYGAEALFGEGQSKDIIYSDADIEELIDKTEQDPPPQPEENAAAQAFSFAKIWTADHSLEEFGDDNAERKEADDAWAQTWQRIIETNESQQEQQREVTGRGARRRTIKKAQFIPDIDDSPENSPVQRGQKHHRLGYDSDGSVFGSDVQSEISSSDAGSSMRDIQTSLPSPLDSADATNVTRVQGADPRSAALISIEPAKSKKEPSKSRPAKAADAEYCGLCRRWHGNKVGDCPMTQKSEYLAEYRQMLMLHADDESDELRLRAINAVEVALKQRGDEHLLDGQPLHFVPGSALGRQNKAKAPRATKNAKLQSETQRHVSGSKRPAPFPGEGVNKPKKVKHSQCGLCSQPLDHPWGKCSGANKSASKGPPDLALREQQESIHQPAGSLKSSSTTAAPIRPFHPHEPIKPGNAEPSSASTLSNPAPPSLPLPH